MKKTALDRLRNAAEELRKAEQETDLLRRRRNELIYEACTSGFTERAAAAAAGVSAPFTHRCVAGKGDPAYGGTAKSAVNAGRRKPGQRGE